MTQFQFTGWPDHGVPQYATGLLQFIRKIRAADENASGPIISHCRYQTLILIELNLLGLFATRCG